MSLHLIWLIPAAIFTFLFYREPRSLFNAYLLTFTLIMMGIVLAGLTIVSLERFIGYTPAMISFYILLLAIPISIFASTAYLIFTTILRNLSLSFLYHLRILFKYFSSQERASDYYYPRCRIVWRQGTSPAGSALG